MLLTYSEDAKKSQLTSKMFYKDDASWMKSLFLTAANGNQPNTGLHARRQHRKQSAQFDMIVRIHSDIMFQEHYMLNEMGIKVRLVRSKNNDSMNQK